MPEHSNYKSQVTSYPSDKKNVESSKAYRGDMHVGMSEKCENHDMSPKMSTEKLETRSMK